MFCYSIERNRLVRFVIRRSHTLCRTHISTQSLRIIRIFTVKRVTAAILAAPAGILRYP